MENIAIVGSSGHAKVIIDIVRREGRFKIAGLLDRFRSAGEHTLGYSVLGKEEDLPALVEFHSLKGIIVAIGDNFVRAKVAERVKEISPGLSFVTAVHPHASIGTDVSIGDGTVIMAGVSANASASIGRFCILNTNCSLDHDSVLEDYSSLAPGVAAAGHCRIGRYSAIGIGAVLIQGAHVGEHSVVGAGSLVTRPVDSHVVAYGTPARTIRTRSPGDAYL